MVFQFFFALCRCFQSFDSRRSSTSEKIDFERTQRLASIPITLDDCKKVAEENERTIKDHQFTSGWKKVKDLGQGGFGNVTLIRKVGTKTLVARKVVLSQPSEFGFSSEEVIHTQMSHPNIVKLFCWEWKVNKLSLYLEYCSRGDIQSTLYDLTRKEIRSYFQQLMDGVEYIHSRGIVHRDLKLDNLLLTKEKVLKIADFGLADFFIVDGEEIRLTGKVGAKSYMAPEVLQCQEGSSYLGPPVDLWSCGIVLFAMLTTCEPWAKANIDDEDYKMWMERDEKMEEMEIWKELDTSSRTLLDLLLATDPLQRISGWRKHGQD
ncbi:serine/threonine-protein kinase Chk1-like [Oratosquilla oratoria]|uniref:serine/threonine-protein kinase Chk1-like n=1 Tax=Oratosquilla oratoria TaxID=337810 RepID=UPI003F772A66